jgi:hypothetical protein
MWGYVATWGLCKGVKLMLMSFPNCSDVLGFSMLFSLSPSTPNSLFTFRQLRSFDLLFVNGSDFYLDVCGALKLSDSIKLSFLLIFAWGHSPSFLLMSSCLEAEF